MENSKLKLSVHGLANIPMIESGNDFEFVFAESDYRCPSIVAGFLSPKIADLLHRTYLPVWEQHSTALISELFRPHESDHKHCDQNFKRSIPIAIRIWELFSNPCREFFLFSGRFSTLIQMSFRMVFISLAVSPNTCKLHRNIVTNCRRDLAVSSFCAFS
jgi:hypothetical protein